MAQAACPWSPPSARPPPARGKPERPPINRLFFAGRNHHAHAVEMGRPVDKNAERPFCFTQAPRTLVDSGATVAYPPATKNHHDEMEPVLVIGKPGFRIFTGAPEGVGKIGAARRPGRARRRRIRA